MAKLAAVGFFVYGGVYVLVGALAAKVAFGTGGRITGSQGAILALAREPFGGILLILVVVGLFAYALWRIVQAIADPERHGAGLHGVAIRGGRVVSAVSYGALAIFTLETVLGARSTGGGKNWALRLLTDSVGAVLGTIVGLIILGAGITQFYKAWKGDFGEPMHESRMTGTERTGGHLAARLGFSARGVVFTGLGVFFLYAVFDANPRRAKSVEALLAALLSLPYGHWILGAVALGLAGYGMFMVLVAMHRRHPY